MTTFYTDPVDGNNANLGTSPGVGGAWQTLTYAESQVSVGDHLFIRNNGNYNETLTLTRGGASGQGSIIYEGYANDPGDGGIAVIDGESIRANGITTSAARAFRVFRNIRVQNTTSVPFNIGSNGETVLENCRATGTLGSAFVCGGSTLLLYCESVTPQFTGMTTGTTLLTVGCRVRTPGIGGIHQTGSGWGFHIFDEVSKLPTNVIAFSNVGGATQGSVYVNCIADGAGAGYGFSSATPANGFLIVNTMVLKLQQGIRSTATSVDGSRVSIFDRVMTNGNTAIWGNGFGNDTFKQFDEVAVAPAFVNETGGNYRPAADDSPQVGAGRDLSTKIDIGAWQRRTTPAGGGGPSGSLMRPKILDGGNTT